MLPNSTSVVVPLNRLTRLYDSVEQLDDLWGDDEGTIDEEGYLRSTSPFTVISCTFCSFKAYFGISQSSEG